MLLVSSKSGFRLDLDAAPESPLDAQDLENAFAQVEKLTNNHEVSDRRDRHLKNRH